MLDEVSFNAATFWAAVAAVKNAAQQEEWAALRSVREQVLKVLEEARTGKLIGRGLEAQVTIAAEGPTYESLHFTGMTCDICSSCPQSRLCKAARKRRRRE